MNGSRSAALLIALALTLTGWTSAWADVTASGSAERRAAAHFDRGVVLSKTQEWGAALAEFELAYALSPAYQVLYNVAECRSGLRDYAGALRVFEQYLKDAGAAGMSPERRRSVLSTVERLRGRVAHVRISTNVAGAEIRVDDVVVGVAPLSAPISVSAGRRKVSLAAGAWSVVRYVEVAGEDVADLELMVPEASAPAPSVARTRAHFAASPAPPAPPAEQPFVSTPVVPLAPPPDGARHERRAIVPWLVALGVAAAGASVGTAFGVMALTDKHALERACPGKTCPSSSQPLIDDSHRAATWSTVGFGVAALGVSAGLTYLLWPSAHESRGAAGTQVHLYLSGVSAGAAGTF